MDEIVLDKERLIINFVDGRYTLLNVNGVNIHTFQVGDTFELFMFNAWHVVRLESGGYKGVYYITVDGQRGRLALGMQARLLVQSQAEVTTECQSEKDMPVYAVSFASLSDDRLLFLPETSMQHVLCNVSAPSSVVGYYPSLAEVLQ